jgi:hypothetical protein
MQRGLPDLLERQAVAGMATAPVLLPTPTARAYGSNQSASAGAAARPSRATSAARLLLPTPTVADSRPAANATAGRRTPPPGASGTTLTDTARLLPTPRATDGAKGCPAQRGSKGDLTLPAAAVRLDTRAPSTVEAEVVGGGPYAQAALTRQS